MNKTLSFITCFLLALTGLKAQSTFTQKITLTALPILEMKVDNNLTSSDFVFNSVADYQNGKTKMQAIGISVVSNLDWVVNVKSTSSAFNPQTVGDIDIPSSVFLINKTGSNEQILLSTENQTVAKGGLGGFEKNHFLLDYTAKPGSVKHDIYDIEVVYTLSPQ
jgi:hypothetical protein